MEYYSILKPLKSRCSCYYGNLVQATINFVMSHFVFVILGMLKEQKEKKRSYSVAAAPAGPTQEEDLNIEI
jgi:large-conductance mechanosensitive channel